MEWVDLLAAKLEPRLPAPGSAPELDSRCESQSEPENLIPAPEPGSRTRGRHAGA
jgi:hypothetical protein